MALFNPISVGEGVVAEQPGVRDLEEEPKK
jgi:hypothetical protein